MEPLRSASDRRPLSPLDLLLAINLAGLLLVAVWFRCRWLGNVPGINGDEAWYGVKAWQFWRGQSLALQTPTGNPPNWFFLGPLILLHAVFQPSIVVLRSVALLGGVAALAVNWFCCRWVFDRRTAIISTVVLAVLPINIAYSRFAWDASQSVAMTLPVLYFSLAAVRFRERQGRWLAAAMLAQIAAFLVHPTNIFAGAAILAALATRLRWADFKRLVENAAIRRRLVTGVCLATVTLVVLAVVAWKSGWGPSRFVNRMGPVGERFQASTIAGFSTLYPRLFTGETAYRYLAGSGSWFRWPGREGSDGWGIDVVLFWTVLAAAGACVWRSWKVAGRWEDRVLISAWALELLAFLLIAGPSALTPGWERWAICLIGPTVVLAARGGALGPGTSPRRFLVAGVAASLCGWLVLADYQTHYFHFIRTTGGHAHETFRAGTPDPKQAAFAHIRSHRDESQRDGGITYVVTGAWHNYWPLRYFAVSEEEIRVVNPKEAEALPEFDAARRQGRVWYVEYSAGKELEAARAALAGRDVQTRRFRDYGGRPVLEVLHGK